MKSGGGSLLVALGLSLAVHVTIALLALSSYRRDLYATRQLAASATPTHPDSGPVYLDQPPDHTNDEIGEADHHGFGFSSVDGRQEMKARQGDEDQPFASRDPSGPGAVGNLPSMSVETLGDGSGAMPARPLPGANGPLLSPSPDPPAPAAAFGIDHAELPPVPVASGSSPQPIARNNPVAIPQEPVAALPPSPPAVALNTPAPAEPLVPAQTAEPRPAEHPGQRQPPADPAPMTDVESDPFSKMGSATFHAGKLEARSGRRVKTVRPRLSLAAQYDLLALTDPNVILKVKIDSTGKVVSVDILRSSGSSDVDLCCQQAMYQWWIEPLKNAAGQPQPDVMVWHLYWK